MRILEEFWYQIPESILRITLDTTDTFLGEAPVVDIY